MTLKILNTESKKLEEFKSLHKNKVNFYQCGPTLYWTQHIGNLRAVVLSDLINRSLKYLNYEVNFVRNYTDVGHLSGDNDGDADTGIDRMEKASVRENLKPLEIADKYKKEYEIDIQKMNTLFPTHTPEATKYIQEMQEMISELLEKDSAYSTPLAIYFDVSKATHYHRLTNQTLEKNISGAGTGEVKDSDKKNPEDFALWFFKAGKHKSALQTWESPFQSNLVENGQGFPGWHIECSAMGRKLCGNTLDIKMGGIEHKSIHHTNEIAQSESANGEKYVNYWVHNEHLLVDNKKMSKSDGTSYSLSDVEEKGFSALDLRYFFLQAHYRSKQNFTWESLEASQTAREKLVSKLKNFSDGGEISEEWKDKFIEKIEDDFSIPEALALVWEILKSDLPDKDKKETILNFDEVLGLNLKNEILREKTKIEANEAIYELLKERKLARKNKDWKKSDEIRDKIQSLGFEIKDIDGEQILEKK